MKPPEFSNAQRATLARLMGIQIDAGGNVGQIIASQRRRRHK
jgi:hypothetical protein